jgi:beta-1,4-N-acetylglucosaminyltransferase
VRAAAALLGVGAALSWFRRSDVCLLVASSGGHLLQLVQLKDEWSRSGRNWVTFDMPDAHSLLRGESVTHAYHPTNRNAGNLLRNLALAVRLCLRVRPKAIVTTGAGLAVPFCYVGRLFGARIVYIESFSRIVEPSLTGRLVHPVAHRFFVQWPQLRRAYRKAEFRGAVF